MEQSKESSSKTKEQEYMRRAKEMILHPDLPIARAWVDGDVEGKTSESIVVEGEGDRRPSGLLNGAIEDIVRLAAVKATHSEAHVPFKVDRYITLIVYDEEEGIKRIAEEIPRLDFATGWKEPWPAILEYVPLQPELGMKVAFGSSSENKDRIIQLLKPETKFEIMQYNPPSEKYLTIVVEV